MEWVGWTGRFGIDVGGVTCIKSLASWNLLYSARSSAEGSEVTQMDGSRGGNGREVQEEGDVCTRIADSHRWTAETEIVVVAVKQL